MTTHHTLRRAIPRKSVIWLRLRAPIRAHFWREWADQQPNRTRGICSAAALKPTKPKAKSQRLRAGLPDTLLPVIQLSDLWVLRRLLETAAPGPNYLVLKHAILEPNDGPMEA